MYTRKPLKTKVIAPDASELVVSIEVPNSRVNEAYLIGPNNEKFGDMTYTVKSDVFQVDRVNNYKEEAGYKHVSSALLEFAFRESVRLGKGGHVDITSSHNSHHAYYKVGFSPKHDLISRFSLTDGEEIIDLSRQYLEEANEEVKKELEEKIKNITNPFMENNASYYINAKKAAQKLLGREANDFYEVVRYGMFYSLTERWDKQLAN